MSLRRRGLGWLSVMLLFGAHGCGHEPPADEEVLARVDDSVLTESDLRAALPVERTRDPAQRSAERRELIEKWVERELLVHEALERHMQKRPGVAEQIEESRRDLLAAALLDEEFDSRPTAVDDAAIETYYQSHLADFQRTSPEIHVEHILLASRRDANARLLALKRGESFEKVAQEFSLDPDTRYRGGDLGFFSEETDPVLWTACKDLPLNKISRPIRTEYGYHLFRVLERADAGTVRPLDQVRKQIIEALVKQRQEHRLDSLLTELRRRHTWQITPPSADSL